MPYSIGEKGSYGCSGYPVVKDGTSEVMGCHDSAAAAQRQIAAINMSEAEKGKKKMTSAMGQPEPASYGKSHFNWSTPVRKPERSSFSIGKADAPEFLPEVEEDFGEDVIEKADGYSPTSGMKAAARRALKWKEDGKANGAGTAVGWGRASDIVAGRSMSLSVVKRMYSFFSRHEVDKKGKGFYSGPDFPSKGRVMWDAWGGDAGYSWSRKIAERESKKSDSLFDWGGIEDLKAAKQAKTEAWFAMRSEQKEIDMISSCNCGGMGVCNYCQEGYAYKADGVRVGQMVSWNSSGGTARGKVKRIITNGSYKVPGTDVTVTGTPEDPAAVITLYRDGEPTDTVVAHKVKTLRGS